MLFYHAAKQLEHETVHLLHLTLCPAVRLQPRYITIKIAQCDCHTFVSEAIDVSRILHHQETPEYKSSVHFDDRLDISRFFCFLFEWQAVFTHLSEIKPTGQLKIKRDSTLRPTKSVALSVSPSSRYLFFRVFLAQLYQQGRLCQLGGEFCELEVFAKVLRASDKR